MPTNTEQSTARRSAAEFAARLRLCCNETLAGTAFAYVKLTNDSSPLLTRADEVIE